MPRLGCRDRSAGGSRVRVVTGGMAVAECLDMRVAALVLALAFSIPAFAQAPGEVAPLPAPAQPHKDPSTAVALSVSTTAVGLLMFAGGASSHNGTTLLLGATGMFFGPSIGVWYGGGTGLVGLGGRVAGFLMVLHGIDLDNQAAEGDCLGLSTADCNALVAQQNDQERTAKIFAYGGLAVWGAATIYDFVDAHRATSRWNREHALTLAPMVSPHTSGLSLSLRF